MKFKKALAITLVLAVMIAALSLLAGCSKKSEEKPAEPTKGENAPAEQTKGENKTAEPAKVEDESVEPTYLFDKGVWSASVDGKIDTYFLFYDQKSGRTERADGTGGVPFTCEQKGTTATFHFGSSDDVTKATFSMGNNTGTCEYGEKTVVYYFELVSGAEPDSFEVPAQANTDVDRTIPAN